MDRVLTEGGALLTPTSMTTRGDSNGTSAYFLIGNRVVAFGSIGWREGVDENCTETVAQQLESFGRPKNNTIGFCSNNDNDGKNYLRNPENIINKSLSLDSSSSSSLSSLGFRSQGIHTLVTPWLGGEKEINEEAANEVQGFLYDLCDSSSYHIGNKRYSNHLKSIAKADNGDDDEPMQVTSIKKFPKEIGKNAKETLYPIVDEQSEHYGTVIDPIILKEKTADMKTDKRQKTNILFRSKLFGKTKRNKNQSAKITMEQDHRYQELEQEKQKQLITPSLFHVPTNNGNHAALTSKAAWNKLSRMIATDRTNSFSSASSRNEKNLDTLHLQDPDEKHRLELLQQQQQQQQQQNQRDSFENYSKKKLDREDYLQSRCFEYDDRNDSTSSTFERIIMETYHRRLKNDVGYANDTNQMEGKDAVRERKVEMQSAGERCDNRPIIKANYNKAVRDGNEDFVVVNSQNNAVSSDFSSLHGGAASACVSSLPFDTMPEQSLSITSVADRLVDIEEEQPLIKLPKNIEEPNPIAGSYKKFIFHNNTVACSNIDRKKQPRFESDRPDILMSTDKVRSDVWEKNCELDDGQNKTLNQNVSSSDTDNSNLKMREQHRYSDDDPSALQDRPKMSSKTIVTQQLSNLKDETFLRDDIRISDNGDIYNDENNNAANLVAEELGEDNRTNHISPCKKKRHGGTRLKKKPAMPRTVVIRSPQDHFRESKEYGRDRSSSPSRLPRTQLLDKQNGNEIFDHEILMGLEMHRQIRVVRESVACGNADNAKTKKYDSMPSSNVILGLTNTDPQTVQYFSFGHRESILHSAMSSCIFPKKMAFTSDSANKDAKTFELVQNSSDCGSLPSWGRTLQNDWYSCTSLSCGGIASILFLDVKDDDPLWVYTHEFDPNNNSIVNESPSSSCPDHHVNQRQYPCSSGSCNNIASSLFLDVKDDDPLWLYAGDGNRHTTRHKNTTQNVTNQKFGYNNHSENCNAYNDTDWCTQNKLENNKTSRHRTERKNCGQRRTTKGDVDSYHKSITSSNNQTKSTNPHIYYKHQISRKPPQVEPRFHVINDSRFASEEFLHKHQISRKPPQAEPRFHVINDSRFASEEFLHRDIMEQLAPNETVDAFPGNNTESFVDDKRDDTENVSKYSEERNLSRDCETYRCESKMFSSKNTISRLLAKEYFASGVDKAYRTGNESSIECKTDQKEISVNKMQNKFHEVGSEIEHIKSIPITTNSIKVAEPRDERYLVMSEAQSARSCSKTAVSKKGSSSKINVHAPWHEDKYSC